MARQGPHVSRFFPVTEEVASPVARAITKTNTQMRVTETKCPIGKGVIVGVAGEMEHGGACVHPMLGKPMRGAIGGGKAVIGSNVKVAAAGAAFDVPLGHKDDSWSFPHLDTITVSVADAPRPDEILVVMAIADGGRLRNRCGTEPIR